MLNTYLKKFNSCVKMLKVVIANMYKKFVQFQMTSVRNVLILRGSVISILWLHPFLSRNP